MKRLDQIKGLAVVLSDGGKRMGTVTRAVLDGKTGHAIGVIWKPDGIFFSERYASFDKILLFGDVSLLLKDACPGEKKPAERLTVGQKVYLTDGSGIGWFTNALIDEADGAICLLEVSAGYLDDLKHGRVWLSSFSWSVNGVIAL